MKVSTVKRTVALILCALLTATLLCLTASCSAAGLYTHGSGGLKVVCTGFAPFDFAREVGGDCVTLTLLQSSGADLHNYQPTSEAIMAIRGADVLVCVGGSSDDAWLDGAVANAANPGLKIVKLTDHADLICTEDIHTVTPHSDHGHEHEHGHDHGDHATDEHVWTSLRNSAAAIAAIGEAFAEKDAANAEIYRENASDYTARLNALDAEYTAAVAAAASRTLVFADRFPFVYMTEDYGLDYYAAFSGCSTEINASFETTTALISRVKELSIDTVLIIDTSPDAPPAVAATVASSTGARILSLNSCQAITAAQIRDGASYIEIMRQNLNVLKEALN